MNLTEAFGMLNPFEVLKPAITIMCTLLAIGMVFKLTAIIIGEFKEKSGYYSGGSSEPKKKEKPAPAEPKEDVYYSDKDHGYWVKLPDGSKTLVDMSELYPHDAAFQKKPSDAERFGTFIYDNTLGKMVRK